MNFGHGATSSSTSTSRQLAKESVRDVYLTDSVTDARVLLTTVVGVTDAQAQQHAFAAAFVKSFGA